MKVVNARIGHKGLFQYCCNYKKIITVVKLNKAIIKVGLLIIRKLDFNYMSYSFICVEDILIISIHTNYYHVFRIVCTYLVKLKEL